MLGLNHCNARVTKVQRASDIENDELRSCNHVGGSKLGSYLWAARYPAIWIIGRQGERERRRHVLVVAVSNQNEVCI